MNQLKSAIILCNIFYAEAQQSLTKYFRYYVLMLSIVLVVPVVAAPALQNPPDLRDGQHDLDFNIGTWTTHIRRLLQPLTGSHIWADMNGRVYVRKIWDGRAQLEETEADGQSGHFESLNLFLYHPKAHQWAQYFADGQEGVVYPPNTGEFRNRKGYFLNQKSYNGKMILVRSIWSDITADAYRLETAWSDDGGETWETNYIETITRDRTPESNQTPTLPALSALIGAHDFDFHFGKWKTHIHRLSKPLTASNTWADYDGNSLVSKVWGGRASLLELDVNGPSGHLQGIGLRLSNPKAQQWSLNWVNGGSDPFMTTPMIGQFNNGSGQFYDQEDFQDRKIMSRNVFSDITDNSSRFEQSFSDDFGKTWELNWIMTFNR